MSNKALLGGRSRFTVQSASANSAHESMAVHHITDAMVEHSPPWTLALDPNGLNTLGSPDYFVSHNADFERAFLTTSIPFICALQSRGAPLARRITAWLAIPALSPDRRPMQNWQARRTVPGPDVISAPLLLQRILAEATASVDDMVRDGQAAPRFCRASTSGSIAAQVGGCALSDYLQWVAYKSDMDRDARRTRGITSIWSAAA